MEGEAHAHLPVLVDEVTFLLRPRRGGWVVDGTIGMGGHAERLLEAGGEGTRVLGIDSDPEALERARRRLARFGDRVRLRQGSFKDMSAHAEAVGVSQAASVLLDEGIIAKANHVENNPYRKPGQLPRADIPFDGNYPHINAAPHGGR